MCELLGCSFDKPINPASYFKILGERCCKHPDGWGIAFYSNGKTVQMLKEPVKAMESSLFRSLLPPSELLVQTPLIAHIRKASQGVPSMVNTHPFFYKNGEKEWIFAHNGNMHDFKNALPLVGKIQPLGECDSEHIFCFLLERIRERNDMRLWVIDDWDWLANIFRETNTKADMLNCLLSDGNFLICYHDNKAENKTPLLHYKQETQNDSCGYLIATNPLDDSGWVPFQKGEILVFLHGTIKYSNKQ